MEQYYYAIGAGIAALIVGVLIGKSLKPAAAPPVAVELPKPAPAPEKPKPDGAPLRILNLLQAESRLIDFLLEDISAAADAKVGLAVKDIHRKAQAALKQHLVLEPILSGAEGESVTVAKGFHPSAVRVLGNVAGDPPYTGELLHPGWRVKEIKLAAPAGGVDEFVLQPAEVQVA